MITVTPADRRQRPIPAPPGSRHHRNPVSPMEPQQRLFESGRPRRRQPVERLVAAFGPCAGESGRGGAGGAGRERARRVPGRSSPGGGNAGDPRADGGVHDGRGASARGLRRGGTDDAGRGPPGHAAEGPHDELRGRGTLVEDRRRDERARDRADLGIRPAGASLSFPAQCTGGRRCTQEPEPEPRLWAQAPFRAAVARRRVLIRMPAAAPPRSNAPRV